jgi:hypothetical protein
MIDAPHPFSFFERLVWLDGRPLMTTIEPYRRAIFEAVLYTFDDDGRLQFNLALCGRAKKNWKTADAVLAALYRLLAWPQPGDCFILANDEGQAADDLSLAKKLVAANGVLKRELSPPLAKEIRRKDGRGTVAILPAGDVAGAHGKTYGFCAFDEIHGYRDHSLFEALAPDPTRHDALTWITSYAGIRHAPGIPLYDFMRTGKAGDDPRMFFSWYGADFTTDPAFAGDEVTQEQRANPSMASWGNDGYLVQQRRRLPTHRFRRLHLNLPGAPDGAAFSGEQVMLAIVAGRKRLRPVPGVRYQAFVDMSGGSNDDAVLAIGHEDDGRAILDVVEAQTGAPPFNPRDAVRKFVGLLGEYGIRRVVGDAYAGLTFQCDFEDLRIGYEVASASKSDLYEAFEPLLNAGEVELLDAGKLQEQLLTLVWRGSRIDHQPGDHDDWANAAAGCLVGLMGDGVPAKSRAMYIIAREDHERRAAAGPSAPAPRVYAHGSLEASRTSSTAPIVDEAERRRLEILNRPPAPIVWEHVNGPQCRPTFAPGSLEYSQQQQRDSA